ncbi:hypothetical protein LCGC14_0838360 [marine sediment metagenome]|uniref:Uncharacterized protein n=1 Tax=marine sediment metagenome TaxID=412755 RepID=A0A0F9PIK0_9ZZZZ
MEKNLNWYKVKNIWNKPFSKQSVKERFCLFESIVDKDYKYGEAVGEGLAELMEISFYNLLAGRITKKEAVKGLEDEMISLEPDLIDCDINGRVLIKEYWKRQKKLWEN